MRGFADLFKKRLSPFFFLNVNDVATVSVDLSQKILSKESR